MKNSKTNQNQRANQLADRLIQGSDALAGFAKKLSASDWVRPVDGDGRTIGVVVHHVANMYPLEIELAQTLASGKPITEATMDVVDKMNAKHAQEFASVGKQETLDFLNKTSNAAAEAVRAFTDAELDNAATVSLNADAPLTAQFFIEDHALRHSFHHLAKIQKTIMD